MAATEATITLHWLEQSRSQRIVWLLEELKVKYDIKTYQRVNQLAPPELKKVHPLGKSPLVEVQAPGQAKPMTLAESGFIAEYLVDHFGPHLAPERYTAGNEGKVGGETEAWMRYHHLLHYQEGSLMPFLVMKLITGNIRSKPPFLVKPITNQVAKGLEDFIHPNIDANLAFLNEQVATSPDNGKYICGPKLTAADILLSFPLMAVKGRYGLDQAKYPALKEYVDRLEQEPGWLAAVKKIEQVDGKPYLVSRDG